MRGDKNDADVGVRARWPAQERVDFLDVGTRQRQGLSRQRVHDGIPQVVEPRIVSDLLMARQEFLGQQVVAIVRGVMLRGATFVDILPRLAALTAIGGTMLTLAVSQYHKRAD